MAAPEQQPEWLRRAFVVRDELAAAASTMNTTEKTGRSGGVSVTLAANGELRAIRIDSKSKQSTATTLQNHIMRAHQEAHEAIKQMTASMMEPLRGLVAQAGNELGLPADR